MAVSTSPYGVLGPNREDASQPRFGQRTEYATLPASLSDSTHDHLKGSMTYEHLRGIA